MSSTDYDDDYEGVDPTEDTSDDDSIDDVEAVVGAEEGEVDAASGVAKGDGEGRPLPDDQAEAESLSPSAKRNIRQQLEDEVARFLAQGGQIQEVPPDETVRGD